MTTKRRSWILRAAAAGLVAVLSSALAPGAMAEDRHDREGRWDRHRDIRQFHDRDLDRWRGGRWLHERHGGRLGWWWVVGGAWYFYPAPVYPYPNPYVLPVIATAPAPPEAPPQYWYYCGSARAYYPYVTSCPEGWRQVVPQPTPPPQ